MEPSHRHNIDNQQLANEQAVTCDGSNPSHDQNLSAGREEAQNTQKNFAEGSIRCN
jgi:hypothetical protein